MTVTEARRLEEVLESLRKAQSVFIVGCAGCATACKTGGEAQVAQVVKALEDAGKTVIGSIVPAASCQAPETARALGDCAEALEAADMALALCCGNGAAAIAANVAIPVVSGCETLIQQ